MNITKSIYSLPADNDGWRVLPDGDRFTGLPIMDAKLRVRKLKVLD